MTPSNSVSSYLKRYPGAKPFSRLISSAFRSWIRWRTTRRLYAAYPEIRRLDEAREEARRKHQPTKHFDAAKTAFLTSVLRQNLPTQRR